MKYCIALLRFLFSGFFIVIGCAGVFMICVAAADTIGIHVFKVLFTAGLSVLFIVGGLTIGVIKDE